MPSGHTTYVGCYVSDCYSIFLGPGRREDDTEDSAGLRPMRLDRGGQCSFNDEHAERVPASEVVSYMF
jgi:hypothetical protein